MKRCISTIALLAVCFLSFAQQQRQQSRHNPSMYVYQTSNFRTEIITRNPQKIGHFCLLFTKDNNLIPDKDPIKAIKNARKQGALVQFNHPGWRNVSKEFTPMAKAALKENLIDGAEVFNSKEFYPDVIDKAVSAGLYIAGNSDIHGISADNFRYYGDIAGSEEMLVDFLKASVEVKVLHCDSKGAKQAQITNRSSFYYILAIPGQDIDIPLMGLSSIICTIKGDSVPVTVCNMWSGEGKHPTVILSE